MHAEVLCYVKIKVYQMAWAKSSFVVPFNIYNVASKLYSTACPHDINKTNVCFFFLTKQNKTKLGSKEGEKVPVEFRADSDGGGAISVCE